MKIGLIMVAASVALTGCAPVSGSLDAQRNDRVIEAQENDSPSLRQKFRIDPDPKRRYDITMTIKDAPGPFGYVGFGAQYDAPDCMYWSDKLAGTTSNPMRILKLPIKTLDDTTYVATVYLDAMLDEDYYGDGVCHWQLTSVTGGLKATGADVETGFGADISPNTILAQGEETRFMWSEYYPRAGVDDFAELGDKTLDKVPLERRNESFTITLASKEMQL